MRTSVSWLNDYLEPRADAEEQASVLTRVGFPCDHSETLPDGSIWQEIETTSNRGDCLCHVGLARELASATGRRLKEPPAGASAGGAAGASADRAPGAAPPASASIKVSVADTVGCPRYTSRVIRGVTVKPSPEWMQQRLKAIGQIPRNNLVDCTNFVLFEMGQPTHVFDLAKLRGSEIRVRRAVPGEKFLPLGEGAQPVTLVADDLVIADSERAVALAGVKGGAETAVTNATRDILLEAATFSGPLVRAVSRRHRIASDSSYRFQRGVHPADIDAAADRLAQLILETAGGTLCSGVVEAGAPLPAARHVSMRPDRCRALLGIDLPASRMMELLDALGFAPVQKGDQVECTVPPRRLDIEREVDLIEEIARLHGLDHLPLRDSLSVRVTPVQPDVQAARAVKALLVGAGFVETITHSLVSERAAQTFVGGETRPLRIDDERAGGEPILRPSTLASLLAVRRRNSDAGIHNLHLFELAAVFHMIGAEHQERRSLGLLADAGSDPAQGFRFMRGVVERLGRLLLGPETKTELNSIPPASPAAHLPPTPALTNAAVASWDGRDVGVVGLISPATRTLFGLEGEFAAAELLITPFLANFPPQTQARELPAFPAIDRDLSVLVEDAVPWRDIERAVVTAKPARLESVEFIGTYRGKQTGTRKSVTFRMLFRDPQRTMRREEADDAVATVVQTLQKSFGAELRA